MRSEMTLAEYAQELSDGELVECARKGSMDAFDTLVHRYRKSIYRLAKAMTQNHDAAGDLSQEAFVQAYKRIRQLKNPESFGPWLRKILVNHCIRHSARIVPASLEDHEIESPESPSADAERSMVRASVRSAILELDPAERAVVLLYYMEGLKQIEIADALGCPVGTVWSRLSSARCKLRGRLADLMS
jgi:RNA polymerase sigma-70 factor (ECF subfamily)